MKFLNSLQVSISDGTALLDIDIRLCGCSLENLRMSNDCLNSASAAARGEAPIPWKKKWVDLERRISRLKEQYNRGRRPLANYWEAVAHAIRLGR